MSLKEQLNFLTISRLIIDLGGKSLRDLWEASWSEQTSVDWSTGIMKIMNPYGNHFGSKLIAVAVSMLIVWVTMTTASV